MPRRPRCDYFDETERDLIILALENYLEQTKSFLADSEPGDDVESVKAQAESLREFIAEFKGR